MISNVVNNSNDSRRKQTTLYPLSSTTKLDKHSIGYSSENKFAPFESKTSLPDKKMKAKLKNKYKKWLASPNLAIVPSIASQCTHRQFFPLIWSNSLWQSVLFPPPPPPPPRSTTLFNNDNRQPRKTSTASMSAATALNSIQLVDAHDVVGTCDTVMLAHSSSFSLFQVPPPKHGPTVLPIAKSNRPVVANIAPGPSSKPSNVEPGTSMGTLPSFRNPLTLQGKTLPSFRSRRSTASKAAVLALTAPGLDAKYYSSVVANSPSTTLHTVVDEQWGKSNRLLAPPQVFTFEKANAVEQRHRPPLFKSPTRSAADFDAKTQNCRLTHHSSGTSLILALSGTGTKVPKKTIYYKKPSKEQQQSDDLHSTSNAAWTSSAKLPSSVRQEVTSFGCPPESFRAGSQIYTFVSSPHLQPETTTTGTDKPTNHRPKSTVARSVGVYGGGTLTYSTLHRWLTGYNQTQANQAKEIIQTASLDELVVIFANGALWGWELQKATAVMTLGNFLANPACCAKNMAFFHSTMSHRKKRTALQKLLGILPLDGTERWVKYSKLKKINHRERACALWQLTNLLSNNTIA